MINYTSKAITRLYAIQRSRLRRDDKESFFTLAVRPNFKSVKITTLITENLRLSFQWPRVLCYAHYLSKNTNQCKETRWRSKEYYRANTPLAK
jgi:hypothetical protein